MNNGQKDSGKVHLPTKLSAAVPEFVPSRITLKSNLSPLVPEFQPSVSLTPPGSSPHHGDQGSSFTLPTEVPEFHFSGSLTPPPPQSNPRVQQQSKRASEQNKEHSVLKNDANDSSNSKSFSKQSQKKRQKKKKELGECTEQGEKNHLSRHSLTANQVLSDKSLNKVCSEENNDWAGLRVSSGLQQNLSSLPPHHETPTVSLKSDVNTGSVNAVDEDTMNKRCVAPSLTMSYSDKLKSPAPNKNVTSNQPMKEKYLAKNFATESFNQKDKKKFPSYDSTSKRSVNINDGKNGVKSGNRYSDHSREEEKYYDKVKCGDTARLHSADRNQIKRNGSYRKLKSDTDDNWRIKRDFDPQVVSKTDSFIGVKNHSTGFLKKRTPEAEEITVDLQHIQTCEELECNQGVGHDVVHKKGKALTKSNNLNNFSASRTGPAASALSFKSPVSKANINLLSDSQEHGMIQVNNSSFTDQNSIRVGGDFPDLKDSENKIKRPSIEMEVKGVRTNSGSSPRPAGPMSYSAALRSIPQPKVIHAWESEPYNTPQAGILKVPPQATVSEVENEARQGESIEKKKKKKKKKKTEEGAEKPKENSSKKRTQKPIEFDLGIMLQTISKSPAKNFEKPSKKIVVSTGVLHHDAKPIKSPYTKVENKIPHNMLDSTAPLVKRGKERETPARKKPSPLKKIILKEREEKKKARETTEADDIDKIVDDMDVVTSRANDNAKDVIPEEVQSPSEDDKIKLVNGEGFAPSHHEIAAKIHSRRFREYCSQVQDKEVDSVASELLKELVRFQDRQFHRDPIKAKAKRRFVLGLREVSKHLKLRKLKCVIISSNVERIKSEGGLDEALQGIIALCQENEVPVVYALKRQSLGKVLLKKVPVSIVGIFNYDGAEEYFKKLIDLTQRTKQAYTEKWEETRERLAVSLQLSGTKNTEFECKESAEVDVPNMITDVATENSDENGSRDDDSESENEDVITKNEESDLHVVIQDFKLLVTES